MGGGNGAKAQQKRERNAKKAAKGPTSQLGTNNMRMKCNSCCKFWMMQQKDGPTGYIAHHQEKHADKAFDTVMSEVKYNG
ncbi:hypothetical protein BD289DRAFT_435894 [Coniella lustricola]|uniref:Small EDRK-rich factor-like N-terminal domain-containing protein n=1 Tax=Coniella lustricola TaxID=2025994 RepID=A0A2T3A5T0_9PEZI|nr:hypothetical protein BD289DRAFT_435894 [Coniella lustricola]